MLYTLPFNKLPLPSKYKCQDSVYFHLIYLFMQHLFISVWTSGILFYALGYSPILVSWYFQKIFQLYSVIFICSNTMIFQRYFGGSKQFPKSICEFHIIKLLMVQSIVYILTRFFHTCII